MKRTSKPPVSTPTAVQAKILLRSSDIEAIDAIIAAGWATSKASAIRFALKLTSERVAA